MNSFVNNEQWKYTDFNIFKSCTLNTFYPLNTLDNQCKENELILYNGSISSIGNNLISNNIYISTIQDALNNNIKKSKQLIKQLNKRNKDTFTNYKESDIKGGLFLSVPKDLKLKEPIIIKYIIDKKEKNMFYSFNSIYSIEGNTSVKIISEEFFDQEQWMNFITDISIDDNSNVEFIRCSEKPNTKQLFNFYSDINLQSNLGLKA